MVVKDQNVEIYQGNRRRLIFTVLEEEGSSAKDLTGYTVTFAITSTNDEGTPLKSPKVNLKSSDPSPQVVITDAANGVVTVTLLTADTEDLPADVYYIELEVDDGTNTLVVATGNLTVLTNVTNA